MTKIADNELEFMTGESDFNRGALKLAAQFPNIKLLNVTAGANGSYAFYQDKRVFVPSFLLGGTIETVNQSIHYEGTKLAYIVEDEPIIQTHFAFEQGMSYHITVIAENEIVIVYVDDTKVLSNRIFSSINGAHISLFAKDVVVTTAAMQFRVRQ